MNYRVTWGVDSRVVTADSEVDAWSIFCDGNDWARRQPHANQRTIEEVEDVVLAEPVVEPDTEVDAEL